MQERFEEVLNFALLHNASDIHFEEKEHQKNLTISVRTIHGFKEYPSHPDDIKLVQHLKYISNLNLVDEQKPQSGSFTYIFEDKEYYFRLASIKSSFMNVSVLRILNTFYISQTIFEDIIDEIDYILKQDYGLVIFSGPTGSGKTTSMYTLMSLFENKKIYSIEDPVEIHFNNIVQVDINQHRNFGYKEAISQVLRHDPDVICIGEIRDEDAAKMAVRAAFTGHLVICTVHATNASLTKKRLIDLGVSEEDLTDNLIVILNQRLDVVDNQRKSVYEINRY